MTRGPNRARATRRLAAAQRRAGTVVTDALRRTGPLVTAGGTLVAVAALVALGLVNAPGPAQAASTARGYDQMTGSGATASALVDIPWTQGLLDSTNKPIVSTGSELNSNVERQNDAGTYAFMDDGYTNAALGETNYGAFKNLTFTISQTEDIGHGGIAVSWKGGTQTVGTSGIVQSNYMQIMECYGNATTGPSPEDCEYGQGVLPAGSSATIGTRIGDLCASQTLSTVNPTGSASSGGVNIVSGCDPAEPTAEAPTHSPCPDTGGAQSNPDCIPGNYNIPFVPEGGTPLYQAELHQAFDQFSTNELDVATTASNGSGQAQFDAVTNTQSNGLGCGQTQANGTPQGCWLVIVPRGVYDTNGFNVAAPGQTNDLLGGSPLSAGNWAQRVQVHLGYAPLPTFCPLGGTGRESLMEGSQLVTRAVQSWQLKLNQDANCSLIYHMAETPEQEVTNEYTLPVIPGTPTNGLAFTTVPVGDDRLRSGQQLPSTLPNIVYAPVAIVALDFGFHIDEDSPNDPRSGYLSTPVKLTPQLLARSLTQTYQGDVPAANQRPGPAWVQANPSSISRDPLFESQPLNPEVIPHNNTNSTAPLDTVDHSAYYQQIWQWLQADSATAGWLNGAPQTGITIDPDYAAQKLGTPPAIDSMPRAAPCATFTPTGANSGEPLCSTDELPYVTDFDTASAAVLSGNPGNQGPGWNPLATSPTGGNGWWFKNTVEPIGQIFTWAVDATPYTAAYGLVPAQLCDDAGGNCLSPTEASVTAAVTDAKPDSAGLLEVDPASPGAGAYPLTEVVYAAVRTDMPAQALTDYANFISFAVNQGQAPGQAGGNLPPGYLPLTSSLQAQANAVIAKLTSIAGGGPTASPTASNSSSSSPASGASSTATNNNTNNNSNSNSNSNTSSGSLPTATPNGAASTSASNSTVGVVSCPAPTTAITVAPTATASTATSAVTATCTPATGPVIAAPTVRLAAGNTPGQPVGPIRQVLVVVVILGIAGAGGGILLRRGRLPRWPGGPRP